MFSDPITITVSTVERTLPRISLKEGSAKYVNSGATVALTNSNTTSKGRKRTMVRLDRTDGATLISTGTPVSQKFSVYVVIDAPSEAIYEYSPETPLNLFADFAAYLTASSNEVVERVLASEI